MKKRTVKVFLHNRNFFFRFSDHSFQTDFFEKKTCWKPFFRIFCYEHAHSKHDTREIWNVHTLTVFINKFTSNCSTTFQVIVMLWSWIVIFDLYRFVLSTPISQETAFSLMNVDSSSANVPPCSETIMYEGNDSDKDLFADRTSFAETDNLDDDFNSWQKRNTMCRPQSIQKPEFEPPIEMNEVEHGKLRDQHEPDTVDQNRYRLLQPSPDLCPDRLQAYALTCAGSEAYLTAVPQSKNYVGNCEPDEYWSFQTWVERLIIQSLKLGFKNGIDREAIFPGVPNKPTAHYCCYRFLLNVSSQNGFEINRSADKSFFTNRKFGLVKDAEKWTMFQ